MGQLNGPEARIPFRSSLPIPVDNHDLGAILCTAPRRALARVRTKSAEGRHGNLHALAEWDPAETYESPKNTEWLAARKRTNAITKPFEDGIPGPRPKCGRPRCHIERNQSVRFDPRRHLNISSKFSSNVDSGAASWQYR